MVREKRTVEISQRAPGESNGGGLSVGWRGSRKPFGMREREQWSGLID